MTKKVMNVEAQTVDFTFDDESVKSFDLSKVSPEILTKLALHGASQKIGDSYAGAAKACAETDMDPTEYAQAQVSGVIEQLYAGDWTVRVGGAGPGITDLAKALSEFSGMPVEDCATKLADADADTKKGLRAHPAIKVVLERLKAERAAKKVEALQKAAAETDSSGLDAFLNA